MEDEGEETGDNDGADRGVERVEKGVIWCSKQDKSDVHL